MQRDSSSNNKRIAKNTLLLYGRMLLMMVVSLYTSRVVLNTLGVVDYGIYNVAGGVVTMFTFLNTAMITSTQRYLTFELGTGNFERLSLVFSTSVRIHLIIALIIVLLTESIGLWFFYNKMVVPVERMTAAMWVLQLSVVTMFIQVMSVPYNSLIIAHEDMGVFAGFSILESCLKLGIVYLLLIGNIDKLILYAILITSVQLFIRLLYTFHCGRHYEEVKSVKKVDKVLMKEMGSFAGWNLWGNLASMLMGTGVNMLLNIFFGPVVNAARAVSVQVEAAISGFSSNFMMAVNPQITKRFAQGLKDDMHDLIFRASKFTFFLLLTLCLPIIIEANCILTLWLKNVPDYSVVFLRFTLIIMMVNSLSNSMQTAAAATGKVKKYQTVVGCILLSIVPISYFALKISGTPIATYVVYLSVCTVALLARILVIKPLIELSLRQYFNRVLVRCAIVSFFAVAISLVTKHSLPQGVWYSLLMCLLSITIVLVAAYLFGLSHDERQFVHKKVYEFLTRFLIARK